MSIRAAPYDPRELIRGEKRHIFHNVGKQKTRDKTPGPAIIKLFHAQLS